MIPGFRHCSELGGSHFCTSRFHGWETRRRPRVDCQCDLAELICTGFQSQDICFSWLVSSPLGRQPWFDVSAGRQQSLPHRWILVGEGGGLSTLRGMVLEHALQLHSLVTSSAARKGVHLFCRYWLHVAHLTHPCLFTGFWHVLHVHLGPGFVSMVALMSRIRSSTAGMCCSSGKSPTPVEALFWRRRGDCPAGGPAECPFALDCSSVGTTAKRRTVWIHVLYLVFFLVWSN